MRSIAAVHGTAEGPAPFVFQQDSAPAHKARKTLDFLNAENITVWGPQMRPPNSPDLAPLDYGIWPMISAVACKTRAGSVPIMKRRVNHAWRHADGAKIRRICKKFRTRIEKCIRENGGLLKGE